MKALITITETESGSLHEARVSVTADKASSLDAERTDGGGWTVKTARGNVELLKSSISAEAVRTNWAGGKWSLSRALEDWAAE